MSKKIIFGAIAAAAALFLLWLNTKTLFVYDALLLLASGTALYEMAKAFKKLEYNVIAAPLVAAMIAVYPAAYFLGASGILAVLIGAAALAGSIYVLDKRIDFKGFSATCLLLVYPLGFISLVYPLNRMGGSFLILFVLLCALLTDTFAYFVGKAASVISKGNAKKLIPRVSPKKTVAGAVGGVVCCAALMILYWYLIEYGIIDLKYSMGSLLGLSKKEALGVYVLTAFCASVISILGDLFASRIKRECGIKDFGNLIPEHGGIVDRIDAVMFAAAVVYFIMIIAARALS